VYSDPPDKNGDEMLHFVSGHRRVRLRGHSFRDFVQRVTPLLDGTRTVEQVQDEVGDQFAPADLYACLEMLGSHGLLEDAGLSEVPAELSDSLVPQMNAFHDMSNEPGELQRRLLASRATVFGVGGLGASCALGLAAAGLGSVDCVDSGHVSAADTYFSPVFDSAAIGSPRTDALGRRIETANPLTCYRSYSEPLTSEDDVRRIVEGSHFVINCLDDGEIALAYKMNRVCLSLGVAFTSVQASGVEVILGPTVDPHKTACFLCYKMRSVACSDNPEAEFAFQSFLDRRRQDDSARRANLSFGVNIAAQLAGMEALKALTSLPSTTARGRLYVLNLLTMAMQTHVVLRKPWCPACFSDWEESAGA
jgi:adenylyltransferase/sulfurtransferase